MPPEGGNDMIARILGASILVLAAVVEALRAN
jgi:hypothetical protein